MVSYRNGSSHKLFLDLVYVVLILLLKSKDNLIIVARGRDPLQGQR